MRKIKEVLRLRYELGLRQREIARDCSISQGAGHNYLKKAAVAGIAWPIPEGWDEKRIEGALLGEQRPVDRSGERALPDFPSPHEQLQRHPSLTRQLAWEEYRQANPEGYGYSRFCELYGRWRKKQDVVLRQEHKPGEKGFVDWAAATIRSPERSGRLRMTAQEVRDSYVDLQKVERDFRAMKPRLLEVPSGVCPQERSHAGPRVLLTAGTEAEPRDGAASTGGLQHDRQQATCDHAAGCAGLVEASVPFALPDRRENDRDETAAAQ